MPRSQCSGTVTFWYGSGFGSSDSYLWLTMRIRLPILLISSVTFKMTTENIFSSSSFYAYSFLKVHLHHSSKIKSHKKSQKDSRNQGFSSFFLLVNGRTRIWIHTNNLQIRMRIQEAQKHMDPSDPDHKLRIRMRIQEAQKHMDCGSRRLKNIRIRNTV